MNDRDHSDSAITYRGLRYDWHRGSFLSRVEAEYALERVWELCGGPVDWEGGSIVDIPSIDREGVAALFDQPADTLPWELIDSMLPPHASLPLDTLQLPAAGRVCPSPARYSADAPFPIDIVGFAFLMLSRWEEVYRAEAPDCHGRTRLTSQLAYRQNFYDRPVVDEWALVLREWLRARRPAAKLLDARPSLQLTHDVDRPVRFRGFWRVIRGVAGELALRSRRASGAAAELRQGVAALRDYGQDPYYRALADLMSFSEELGLRGCFYLMTSGPSEYDEGYRFHEPAIQGLLDQLRQRGHEIGWHPGYLAAANSELFSVEKRRMDQLLGDQTYGGRHHYLRWFAGTSWERWVDHGLAYDSSLGFADACGFRCGTSRPFPVFSFARQSRLRLIERPLLMMDGALAQEAAAGLEPRSRVSMILRRSIAVGGESVVLIHNSYTDGEILRAMLGGIRDAAGELCSAERGVAA